MLLPDLGVVESARPAGSSVFGVHTTSMLAGTTGAAVAVGEGSLVGGAGGTVGSRKKGL